MGKPIGWKPEYVVYLLKTECGKLYVGSTSFFRGRRNTHRTRINRGTGLGKLLPPDTLFAMYLPHKCDSVEAMLQMEVYEIRKYMREFPESTLNSGATVSEAQKRAWNNPVAKSQQIDDRQFQ